MRIYTSDSGRVGDLGQVMTSYLPAAFCAALLPAGMGSFYGMKFWGEIFVAFRGMAFIF